MKELKSQSLSLLVALWTGVAIALAMAVYAVFQYLTLPDVTVWELAAHHLWHVLVLGAVIYVLCWLAFRQVLLRPLTKIYLHLYGIGTGRLEPLRLPTRVRELQTIVEGVNIMVRRMIQEHDSQAVETFRDALGSLRDSLKRLPPSECEATSEMLQNLAVLERALLSILRTPSENSAAVVS